MFSFENYLPITSFNESSIFFKALEVFRYGFLMESVEGDGRFKQLYSYHNYYVEIIYEVNYEEIKSIKAISINDTLTDYVDEDEFLDAFIDLIAA
ncbi:hypothetical protein N9L92_03725 [Saprospiraceae bacterium]|nr:hypothetical protein [Saprospiraceae bacterium]